MSRTAALTLLAASVVVTLFVAVVAAVAALREVDRGRMAETAEAQAACVRCMGPTWGEPDEPQPTAADLERCCPDHAGPVAFGCERELEVACQPLSAPAFARCERIVSAACERAFPLAPWVALPGLAPCAP